MDKSDGIFQLKLRMRCVRFLFVVACRVSICSDVEGVPIQGPMVILLGDKDSLFIAFNFSLPRMLPLPYPTKQSAERSTLASGGTHEGASSLNEREILAIEFSGRVTHVGEPAVRLQGSLGEKFT